MGLTGGRVFDLARADPDDGLPWDLSVKSKREKAMWMIAEDDPDFGDRVAAVRVFQCVAALG
eukprot:7101144-Lingulodinium_polyedra.AAC.1